MRKTFSDTERKAIAMGWHTSALPQKDYADQFGIQPRTLRLWVHHYAPVVSSPKEIKETAQQVLGALLRAASQIEEALERL